jgi:hypothetical protein
LFIIETLPMSRLKIKVDFSASLTSSRNLTIFGSSGGFLGGSTDLAILNVGRGAAIGGGGGWKR